jgi:hypothetical protein
MRDETRAGISFDAIGLMCFKIPLTAWKSHINAYKAYVNRERNAVMEKFFSFQIRITKNGCSGCDVNLV